MRDKELKELVIISGKGGSGKTSITLALSSLFDNKVMVDGDVDAADMHLILHPTVLHRHDFYSGKKAVIDKSSCIECGLCRELCVFQAIDESITVNEFFCEGCGACTLKCPVGCISLETQKSGEWYESQTRLGPLIHAKLGVGEENSGKLVTQIKSQARATAQQTGADLVIVDGSPGIGCPVIASLMGADMALVVIEPTVSGLHDAKRVIELAKHFNVLTVACINKYNLNPAVCCDIETYLAEQQVALLGKIPYSKEFTAAMAAGQTLIEFDADSPVSAEIKMLNHQLERMLHEGR